MEVFYTIAAVIGIDMVIIAIAILVLMIREDRKEAKMEKNMPKLTFSDEVEEKLDMRWI